MLFQESQKQYLNVVMSTLSDTMKLKFNRNVHKTLSINKMYYCHAVQCRP